MKTVSRDSSNGHSLSKTALFLEGFSNGTEVASYDMANLVLTLAEKLPIPTLIGAFSLAAGLFSENKAEVAGIISFATCFIPSALAGPRLIGERAMQVAEDLAGQDANNFDELPLTAMEQFVRATGQTVGVLSSVIPSLAVGGGMVYALS